jgi:tripartite-type tricarboxylate transporter receptor subunit TctC
MKRSALVGVLSVAGLLLVLALGYGQGRLGGAASAYPTKPVRIIAASPATTGDLLARYLAQQLNERWGQPVVVENRAGAGAIIAAEAAAKAVPDGYTLPIGQLASFSAAVSLYKTLCYDPLKDFAAIVLPNALPQVKAGKARAYAVTSKSRFAGAPEVPTAHEAGLPGFEASGWFGMLAPARTPPSLVDRLNRDMVEILRTPATEAWLLSQGAVPSPGTPAAFAEFIRSETVKWKKVIEAAGVKPG